MKRPVKTQKEEGKSDVSLPVRGSDGAGSSRKAPSHGVRRLPRKKTSADGDIGGYQPKVRRLSTREGRDGHRPPLQTAGDERTLGSEVEVRGAGLVQWRKGAADSAFKPHEEGEPNPLLNLPEEDRAKLYTWLRECPYDDAVRHVLRDQGVGEVSSVQLMEFFQLEAEHHWETRITRAAVEANALVQLVEKSPVKFSSGILAALGQEAFRQIASGQVEPESMGKIATLFLRARSDERADQMQELKREKVRRDLESQVGLALEKLAEEVDKHPMAREAFEALRREMERSGEEEI